MSEAASLDDHETLPPSIGYITVTAESRCCRRHCRSSQPAKSARWRSQANASSNASVALVNHAGTAGRPGTASGTGMLHQIRLGRPVGRIAAHHKTPGGCSLPAVNFDNRWPSLRKNPSQIGRSRLMINCPDALRGVFWSPPGPTANREQQRRSRFLPQRYSRCPRAHPPALPPDRARQAAPSRRHHRSTR